MSVKNPKEFFVVLLSELRQGTERTTKIFQEISQVAQNPDIKEALEARAFVSDKVLATLDQCFKLIGEQPVKLSGRMHDIFVEDFRKELAEIESPVARHLFILAKANHLIHLRIAEYVTLIAAADMTGHYGVGVLLESCLADTLAFVERTRRLILLPLVEQVFRLCRLPYPARIGSAVMRAAVSPRKPTGHVLFRQRRSVSTRSSRTLPIYFASARALQCCGAAVASRATGGGVASPVSVLTRGSVRGAPFLTNSVLISTF